MGKRFRKNTDRVKSISKRRKRIIKMIFIFVLLLIILSVIVIFPPSKGEIPKFYDDNGAVLPNSISEKHFLEVDGEKLGMIISAKNSSNPVLLVCGRGPGIPEYLLESMYPTNLADNFVVCYFEYRGTGLSYHSDSNADNMTTERYVSDVIEVIDYLRSRFQKEKIYILGHSFGTYAALKTVQKSPESYYAYIAMSQICNQKESEYLAYDYMKQQYEQSGNHKMVKQFEAYPIRDSEEIYENYFSSSLRDNAMHNLGIGTTREMKSVISGIFFPSLRYTAYTRQERINIWKGKAFSAQFPVTKDAITFNAFEAVTSLQVPIYFFAGKYDYTCCYSLQRKYYEQIEVPLKDFFTFENSAHSPLFEEPEKARERLQVIVDETCPSS